MRSTMDNIVANTMVGGVRVRSRVWAARSVVVMAAVTTVTRLLQS